MKNIFNYMTVLAAAAMLAAPVVANAQEEEKPDVVMSKTVSGPDANGIYNLTLESYVTGKAIKIVEETRIPLEVVLVLDVSGSMDDKASSTTSYSPKSSRSYSYDDIEDATYYYKDGDAYYEVKSEKFVGGSYYYLYCSRTLNDDLYLSGTSTTTSEPKNYTDPNQTIWTGTLYSSKDTGSSVGSKGYSYNSLTGTLYFHNPDATLSSNKWLTVKKGSDEFNAYAIYYEKNHVRYYLSGNSVTTTRPNTVRDSEDDNWTGVLYTATSSKEQKIVLLQKAVSDFIDIISKDADEFKVDHRISIVKFAENEYYESESYLGEGNHNEWGEPNYTEVVKNRVSLPTGESALVSAVNALTTGDATAADYGMKKAYYVLAQSGVPSNSEKVVILFTDGDPTHSDGFSTTVAGNTITNSKKLKDLGASVYSIGIFDSNSDNRTKYMNWVSSNYPDAEDWYTGGSPITEGANYYQKSNGADLSTVFKTIASEIIKGGASVEVTSESQVLDVITTDFTIPGGFDSSKISVKVADYVPETDSFKSELKAPVETISINKKDNADGSTNISVTGYPFSDHWCGEGCGTTGQKLVISIPIVPKDDCLGGLDIPTNGSRSGLYLNETSEDPLASFEIPTIDLPISIIVLKEGLANGESSIFEIFSSKDGYNAAIATLMLTGGLKEKDKVTGLDPNYIYKVQEADWSWTYEVEAPVPGILTTEGVKQNPFVFKNKKGDNDVKNAEATIINKFEKIK